MNKIKTLIIALALLSFTQIVYAQDPEFYLQKARQRLTEGDCTRAEISYNTYKDLTHKTNKEIERLIEECKTGGSSGFVGTGTTNGHEWVDLGLPSGTLWATWNVGASKPEDFGNYYALGETETKKVYNWDTYKYAIGEYKMTKYLLNGYFNEEKPAILEKDDDPATSNWGRGWRTPSKIQWEELLQYTINQWTTRNGVAGRLFTSKKNGKSIFFPAAGNHLESELNHCGSIGFYWSIEFGGYLASAWYLYLDSEDCSVRNYYCDLGFSVRPVYEK